MREPISPHHERLGGGSTAPELRPYQRAADAAITHQLEVTGVRATLYVAATGTGKTVVIAERVLRAKSHGGRVLVLAHREELLGQVERKLADVGIAADREQGKRRASTTARVVVASVQTLRGARLARWPRDHFALVVIDEAHHAVAAGYRAILDHFVEAKVLGVTATPVRADGKGLGEIFESVAYRYEIRDAIRDGYLVPIVARQVEIESVDLRSVPTRAGDFAVEELGAVMADERALLGVVVPLLDLAGDRRTVVFGVDVAHAQALADRINAIRPGAARAVSGKTSEDERRDLLADFECGRFQFLCNCALLTEGWDSPRVSCVAMARPTKSWGLMVQCVGRGMRLVGRTYAESVRSGKSNMLLLNFTGRSKHRLVGPADCLAGSDRGMAAIPDDVAAEVNRLLGTQQLELERVIASADAEVGKRRAQIARDAIVRFVAEEIDPFVDDAPAPDLRARGYDDRGMLFADGTDWGLRPPTTAQLAVLDKLGVTVSRVPSSFTMLDAFRLISRLQARPARGLCTLAQARAIAQGTGIDTRAITFQRAAELCALLRHGSWRPQALFGTPEYRAAQARGAGVAENGPGEPHSAAIAAPGASATRNAPRASGELVEGPL